MKSQFFHTKKLNSFLLLSYIINEKLYLDIYKNVYETFYIISLKTHFGQNIF